MAEGRRWRWPVVAASAVLTAAFLLAGVSKLASVPGWWSFGRWRLPEWFRVFAGAAEVAGAIGLWIPGLRAPAALGLTCVMGGALVVHLRHGEEGVVAVPLLLLLLSALVAWARRRELPWLRAGAAGGGSEGGGAA